MSRNELELEPFEPFRPPATLDDELTVYLIEEMNRIKRSLDLLLEAGIQIADTAPDAPRRGTIRYNIDPWDPLSDGLEGLVVYDGTSWVAVGTRA